jgi:hypothetical protein
MNILVRTIYGQVVFEVNIIQPTAPPTEVKPPPATAPDPTPALSEPPPAPEPKNVKLKESDPVWVASWLKQTPPTQ